MIPFTKEREDNYIAGAAFDVQTLNFGWGFTGGAEIGLSGRFGDNENTSAELWFGTSLRHSGIKLGPVTVKPGIVTGFSAVTDTIGIETRRERHNRGDASLLFYLGPEIAFTFDALPNVDIVVRSHHRSGASGALGKMSEGANANLIGIRFSF